MKWGLIVVVFWLWAFAAPSFAQTTRQVSLERFTGVTPPPRSGGCISANDDDVVVLTAGVGEASYLDTWSFEIGWTKFGGETRSFCGCDAITWWPAAGRFVTVNVGSDRLGLGTDQFALFSWDGDEWKAEPIDGPSPRYGAQIAFDESSGDLLLFGGRNSEVANGCEKEVDQIQCYSDVWAFDGESWRLVDDGCEANGPDCSIEGLGFDRTVGRIRAFDVGTTGTRLWEWSGGWSLVEENSDFRIEVTDTSYWCTGTSSIALDPDRGDWLAFGGVDLMVDGVQGHYSGFWGYTPRGGFAIVPHPHEFDPAGDEGARIAFLPKSDRYLMFGGKTVGTHDDVTDETWTVTVRPKTVFGPRATTGCCSTAPSGEGRVPLPIAAILFGFAVLRPRRRRSRPLHTFF